MADLQAYIARSRRQSTSARSRAEMSGCLTAHPRMTRREIAVPAPDPRKAIRALIGNILAPILEPEPGKTLPRGYVAKRRGDRREGAGTGRVELMIVPRAQLTVTERAMHIRRLRKTRKLSKQSMAFSEADALEAETIDFNIEWQPSADRAACRTARARAMIGRGLAQKSIDAGRLTKLDAEEFSQTLEQIGEGWFRQLALGVRLGVPEALGLTRRQWSDRIGVTVRSAAERRGAVTELSAESLSNRAIADVLGVNDRTVRRDLAGPAANAAPAQMPQGGDTALAAANAADDISEAVAYIVAAGDDVPERVKDAVAAIDAFIRFFVPIGSVAERLVNTKSAN